jgi:hypothetical protein
VSDVLRPRLLVALAALAVLVAPATAALASARDVLNDCTDDEVMSKTYTQKEYRDALNQLAADADQYGNCRQVIERAQLRAASAGRQRKDTGATSSAPTGGGTSGGAKRGGGDGSAGAVGSAPAAQQLADATPAERTAVDKARHAAGQQFELDKTRIDPSKVGAVPGVSQVSDMPGPLVAVLALLLIAALAVAGVRIRSLVNARRG